MIYKITRASAYDDKQAPCDGAYRKQYIETESYCADKLSDLDDFIRYDWYGYGINHRQVDGHFMRDIVCVDYFIKIETLEALQAFIDKYGSIVLYKDSMIIYDDYIE